MENTKPVLRTEEAGKLWQEHLPAWTPAQHEPLLSMHDQPGCRESKQDG